MCVCVCVVLATSIRGLKLHATTIQVMNTAKRVIVIVYSALVFGEKMDRNAKLGMRD